jgi:hypothetical protein
MKCKCRNNCHSGSQIHLIAVGGGLNCNKCHRNRCFRDLLNAGVYVARAICLFFNQDDHALLHSAHMTGKENKENCKVRIRQSAESGVACDMDMNLAILAAKFTRCHPLRQGLKVGWYDADGDSSVECIASTGVSFILSCVCLR